MRLMDFGVDLRGGCVSVTEEISYIGETDARHPQMRTEAVAKRVGGGYLDARPTTHFAQLAQEVGLTVAFLIGKHESVAEARGVVPQKNVSYHLGHGDYAFIGLRLPAEVRFLLNEDHPKLEADVRPG